MLPRKGQELLESSGTPESISPSPVSLYTRFGRYLPSFLEPAEVFWLNGCRAAVLSGIEKGFHLKGSSVCLSEPEIVPAQSTCAKGWSGH